MTRCPKCEAICEQDAELCPSCGTSIKLEIKSRRDEAILAKDSWTFSNAIQKNKQEQKPPTTPHPPRQRAVPRPGGRDDVQVQSPSGAGYAGRSDKKKKFNMTIGVTQFAKATDEKRPGAEQPYAQPIPQPTLTMNTREKPTVKSHVEKVQPRGNRHGKLGSTVIGIGELDPKLIPTKPSPPPDQTKTYKQATPSTEKLVVESTDQQEDDVQVASEAASRLATSPQIVKFEMPPPDHEPQKRGDNDPRRPAAALTDRPKRPVPSSRTSARFGVGRPIVKRAPSLSIALGISSAILVSMWFIPNVWSQDPVFSFGLVATTHGTKLIALLAKPVFGALLLALLIAPLTTRFRAGLSLPTGILALTVPLILGVPALAIDNHITLVATLAITAASSFIISLSRYRILGHIILLLVPSALFAMAVFGVATGKLPAAQLTIFKAPLSIYASMLISAQSIATLLTLAQKEH
ncbi:MAG: hypothetical protein GY854_27480 [Deltaproteobacteria bacterium]|nr:hypothetical protein [Deltaproteobacteria bacterium]